jgi:DNA polymerase (family 10)
MDNKTIAQHFSTLAKLMDIHDENPFKIKTYTNAAFNIDKIATPLSDLDHNKINGFEGLGVSVSNSIIELLNTGLLSALEELKSKTPEGILDLLKIKGIGPKKIKQLWQELSIESPGELLYACEESRLIDLKGFGIKTQNTIHEAVTYFLSNKGSMLYAKALLISQEIQRIFHRSLGDNKLHITGAVLRQEDTIDQLEFLYHGTSIELINYLNTLPLLAITETSDNNIQTILSEHTKIVFYSCDTISFLEQKFSTSCTPIYLQVLNEKITSINDDEHTIYEANNIQYTPPYLRINKETVQLAIEKKIPSIIQLADIKGIIHNHSTYSDGKFSIVQMAEACISKGFEYLVMSDHSQTSFYAKGLKPDRILQQQHEIDELNKKLFPFKILKSIECDILYDGKLDYENDILSTFDLVICSVHQHLKMTEEKAMSRLMVAIENPYTTILGHPTGRLLLSRKPYPINHKIIIDACAKHNVAIEINANPNRLDMDWQWIQYAMQQHVMLSINPDAHSIEGIDDIKYGVLSAQKGMLTKEFNLSSKSLVEFEAFLLKNKKY